MGLNKEQKQKAKYIYEKAIEAGFDETRALSILGNVMGESGLNEQAVNPKSNAVGLWQWLGSRKDNLINTYGKNPTFENQVDYLLNDLKGKVSGWNFLKGAGKFSDKSGYYQHSRDEWMNSNSLEDATIALRGNLRYGKDEQNLKNRIRYAEEIGNELGINMNSINRNKKALSSNNNMKIGNLNYIKNETNRPSRAIKFSMPEELSTYVDNINKPKTPSKFELYNEAMIEYNNKLSDEARLMAENQPMSENSNRSGVNSPMELYKRFWENN